MTKKSKARMSKGEEAKLREQIDIMYGDPETAGMAYTAEQALDHPGKKVIKDGRTATQKIEDLVKSVQV